MNKVAGMRRSALLFQMVVCSRGRAWAPGRRVRYDGQRGAGFTSFMSGQWRGCAFASLLLASAVAWSTGRTAGSFAVSSSGEGQYSIPIFAPPGVNGLMPKLALKYGHRYEGTLAGVGWGVSGLSAIHRCEKTWVQNGVAAATQNALDDRYCLDGSQLRHFSGTYGANGSTYRTEVETYARVTALGSAGNGPASFKVEHKNGLIYEYGTTLDSRILSIGQLEARAWALSRISDRSGSEVTVAWYNDTTNGSYRINHIDYAANSIVFEWESKPLGEVKSGYVTGSQVREIHRLAAIEVHQGGGVIRRYALTYEGPLSTTSLSRLASIQECAGALCRPVTTFSYQDGSAGLQGEVNTAQAVPAGTLPLDVNGDGREDLAYVSSATSGQGTWKVMLATASGGYDPPRDSGQSNANYSDAIPIDYNQDGLGDVLVPYNGTHWYVMLGSASGLGALTATGTAATATGRGEDARALDINGDGRQDLVWADLDGGFAGNDAIRYRLRNAATGGFGNVATLIAAQPVQSRILGGVFGEWNQKQPGRSPDFNGDGRGDIIYRHERRIWNAELGKWDYTRTLRAICAGGGCSFSQNLPGGAGVPSFGDFNADGLTDLFYYSGQINGEVNSSTWWYAFSRGTSFAPPLQHANLNGFTLRWVILDWDGDGRDDVLAGYGTAGEWRLLRATGLGFGAWTSIGLTLSSSPLVTDIDGDGLLDLAYSQSGTWRYRKHAGVRSDLMTQITDGYGNTVSVSYGLLTSPGVHSKTTGATFPEQEWQGPMTVVTRHTASDGIGGSYSVDHTYAGARLHLQGRGFEGVSRHTSVDDRNGDQTHAYFIQLFPNTGSPDLIELRQSNNTLIESTDSIWSMTAPPSGVESRTLPFASKTTRKRYGVGATINGTLLTTTVTDTTMDAATGTPTEIKVTTTEASGGNGIRGGTTWTERTIHSNLLTNSSGTNWCVGRPQRIEQINSNSTAYGGAQTRTFATTWDPVYCRPTEQVLEPDSPQWRLEVDLVYDSFGNLSQQTVGDGAGPLPNRVWVTTWGADGRFPLSTTNPLNQTTRRTFDSRFGLPASETDPNGLATSFVYDGFGRQTSETRPDQTSTQWAYAGCGSSCGQYVTATQKSTSGSTIRTDYVYFDNFDRPYLTRTQLLGGGYSRVEGQYDHLGRLKAESAPCTEGACSSPLYWTNYTYDPIGRPTQISRPFAVGATQTTTITYAGLRTTITDPLGKRSIRTEDGCGRLARSADEQGYAQTFDYDAFGNSVRVTDSTGRVLQSATFNVRGLRESVTDADLSAWQYSFNAFSELVSHTDANGKTTTYTWDPLSRPLTRVMPEGTGSITRSWTWGTSAPAKEIGRLKASQVSGTGVTTYQEVHSYEAKGRPVQTEYFQAGSSIGTTNLSYDATTGLVDSLTYPESTAQYRLKLKYEYDRGLLKRVKDFNAPTVFWEATTMDAYGQIIEETLGGTLRTIRGVEPRTGFLNTIMSGRLADPVARQDLEYVWDLAGNLRSRQDHNHTLTEEFEYDDLHRMKQVKLNGAVMVTRSYEPNGNVATHSTLGTFIYDPAKLHAVASISEAGGGTQAFTYDANGNMTNRDGQELLWFADNRLKRVRKTPGSAANSSEFQYGPDGQRWYHRYNDAGTLYTHVNLGGIFEIATRGAVDDFRHTIHANGVPVALYSRKSTGTNTLRYLLRDHVGSVDVIATSSGAEELRTSFYGFGGRRDPGSWSGAPPSGDVAALREITRRGFTDHEHLDQLNPDLIHMNGRVYDPLLTRFVSADPFIDGVTNTQGWNRYSYVSNNPLSYVDPSGYGHISSADDPPEGSPGGGFDFTYCYGTGAHQVCGLGRPDNPGYQVRWLTDAQMEALALRLLRSLAGTKNHMPWLGRAQTLEDFGALRSMADSFADWWNAESTVTFCGVTCARAWNGDPNSQLAPQENTARNGERILNATFAVAAIYPVSIPARSAVAARGTTAAAREVFHYTFNRAVASIEREGLRAGSYATPNGVLSPLQAQIDLALAPTRGLRGALIRIDLVGLRQAGYEIPEVTQIGRGYGMPGGAYEMQFPYRIPPEYITVIRP